MASPESWLKEIARDQHLSKLTYRVAIRMAYHANFKTGQDCRPGAKRIADEIGLDRDNKNQVHAVADCIRELERAGYLGMFHRSRGLGDANGYYLTTPAAQAARARCDFKHGDGSRCANLGGRPTVAPNGQQVNFCDQHLNEYEEWKRTNDAA